MSIKRLLPKGLLQPTFAQVQSEVGCAISDFCEQMSVIADAEDFSRIGVDASGYVLPFTSYDQSKRTFIKGLLFVGCGDGQVVYASYMLLNDKVQRVFFEDPDFEMKLVRGSALHALASAASGEIPFTMEAAPVWLQIPYHMRLAGRL